MNSFFLVLIILSMSMQDVIRKVYNKKVIGGVYFFTMLSALASLMFFVITSGGVRLESGVLIYSFFFAVTYCTSLVFNMLAIKWGPLSLSALMISFSLLIPTMYGVVFLEENVGKGFYPGVLFLVISLILVTGKNDKVPINFKWLIAALIAFVGNGMCTVAQKMQQIKFDGLYKSELMIFALVIVAVCMAVLSIFTERTQIVKCAKKGWSLAFLCGIFNALMNFIVMIVIGRMNTSLVFPLISAGGIVVTYLISKFVFKENLSRKQFWGLILGICSVILLNI